MKAVRKKRHELIAELLKSREVTSQTEILEYLEKNGIELQQSTLSKDLVTLGVFKKDGVYCLPDLVESKGEFKVERIDDASAILVIRSKPGFAAPIGVAIDSLDSKFIAGCICGDDTVFVAVKSRDDLAAARRELSKLFGS